MSIYIPKSKLLKDLAGKEYYIQDTTANSLDYFNVTDYPTSVGGGKSLIKLKGNGTKLRVGSDIDIEILDSYGNPLYYEVADIIDRFNQYYISIYVYDTTSEGVGTIALTAEASTDPNGNSIPDMWKNKHNIIWYKEVEIKPFERNTADITFATPPEIYVSQVTLPERVSSGSLTKGLYSYVTASNIFTITTANFKGFDKQVARDNGITDLDQFKKGINASATPVTVNSIDTTTRMGIVDSVNAYKINEVNRFNTIIKTSQPFFSASFIGGTFEISGSAPTILQPSASGVTLVDSLDIQVNRYIANIVDVLDNKTAILDKPLTIQVTQQGNGTVGSRQVEWVYKLVSGSYGGVITYMTKTPNYVTSSIVQNYVEFTYTNLPPIAGQVYKIRPFYKVSGRTGDYKLLTDQIIRPVEYLTDPTYPNQTTYARQLTDYYLIGHFTDTASINNYWNNLIETPAGFGYTPTVITNETNHMSSVVLTASQSYTQVLTTNYKQNYIANRDYTLSTYLTLDPGCDLEVYMNSEPLQTTVISQLQYPIAFNKSKNYEPNRYDNSFSRFGKFVGRISNTTNTQIKYGKVGFNFLPDSEGLGKPLFRVKSSGYNTTGSAYLSQVSVTAAALNGFTPNLIQFAIPFDQFPQVVLSQSVDFKLEYFDYTGKQSEYVTYLKDITLNETSEVNSAGCQSEKYTWTFDAPYYHMATQSYYETGSASGFKSQSLWPYAYTTGGAAYNLTTYVPTYSAVNLYTTADLITSSSNTTLKYWPSIEHISGLYLLPATMSLWDNLTLTNNYTQGHYRPTYNIPVFTDGYKMFGIKYTNADISLWNVRRPILQDQNSNRDATTYADMLYYFNGSTYTALTTAEKSLYKTGVIPMDPIGMACLADLVSSPYTGSLKIAHINDYPPYDAAPNNLSPNFPYWDNPSSRTSNYIQPLWKFGSMQGKITSSWNWVSKLTENFGTFNTPELVKANGTSVSTAYYQFANPQTQPDFLGKYLAETSSAFYSRSLQTSSIDNRWFAYEGSVGITRNAVSASYRDFAAAGTNAARTYALKQRRLMFPMNGRATSSFFTTNGGIYDVRFKLKQTGSYRPDTGSYLDVYIFNANTNYTSATDGTPGWKPPFNNIVRIGSGYGVAPVLTNYDPYTGAWYDEYQITLIQYGTPGQIVFEPGGVSGSTDAYFGTLVDDISICKVGITTDPNYIASDVQYSVYVNTAINNHIPATITSADVIKKVDGGTFTTTG